MPFPYPLSLINIFRLPSVKNYSFSPHKFTVLPHRIIFSMEKLYHPNDLCQKFENLGNDTAMGTTKIHNIFLVFEVLETFISFTNNINVEFAAFFKTVWNHRFFLSVLIPDMQATEVNTSVIMQA